jgi:multiple sugar transport system permease protein
MAQTTYPVESPAVAAASPKARHRLPLVRSLDESRFFPTILLGPVLVFFIVWNVVPLLWLLGVSFYRYKLTAAREPQYVGFENLIDIWKSSEVWGLLGRTLSFMVLTVGGATLLGMVLGFLFWGSGRLPGRRLALTLLFTPMVLPPVAVGTFYRLIYDPIFGIANFFAEKLVGQRYDFLGNKDLAFGATIAVDVWMWTPFMILMTLAALASVPKGELEAAEVDQIPWLKRIWYIILPNGKFILMLGILLRTIDAFKTTDLPYLMTNGGPGNTTEFVGLSLYRTGFEAFQMGDASALAIITLLIAIAFASIYLYVLSYRETRAQLK